MPLFYYKGEKETATELNKIIDEFFNQKNVSDKYNKYIKIFNKLNSFGNLIKKNRKNEDSKLKDSIEENKALVDTKDTKYKISDAENFKSFCDELKLIKENVDN